MTQSSDNAPKRERKRAAESDRIVDLPVDETPEATAPEVAKSAEPVKELEPSPDPNDLTALAAPMPLSAAKTVILKVRASTKPPKGKFIRILPFKMGQFGDLDTFDNCFPVYLFEHEMEDGKGAKSFYVHPGTDVAELLDQHEMLKQALLVLGITRAKNYFVWEIKLPDGRHELADEWSDSRLQIAEHATTKWLRPKADMQAGGYQEDVPVAEYADPDWSKVDFNEMVKTASKGRVISSLSHPAVKDALGL